MRTEILLASVFSVSIALYKLQIPYAGVFAHFFIFIAIVVLAFQLKNHAYFNKNRLLAFFALYYKSIAYIAVLYSAMAYPGKAAFNLLAAVSSLFYLVLMLFKVDNKESLNAYIYLQFEGLFYLSFLGS